MITASISSVPKPIGTRTFFGGIAFDAVGGDTETAGFGVTGLCRRVVTAVTGERVVGG